MKKKTKKTTKKTVKKEKKISPVKAAFTANRKAIILNGPGKFKFLVAKIIDSKKYTICGKFDDLNNAAKFCDLMNK